MMVIVTVQGSCPVHVFHACLCKLNVSCAEYNNRTFHSAGLKVLFPEADGGAQSSHIINSARAESHLLNIKPFKKKMHY